MIPVWVALLLAAAAAIVAGCIGVLLGELLRKPSEVDERSQDIKDFKAKYAGRARGER